MCTIAARSSQQSAARTTRAPGGAPTAACIWSASLQSTCARRCRPTRQCGSWQRLCTALPPVPAPQPAQLSRTSAAHARRRRQRQPPKADVCPCTAPCMRRYAPTAQLGSRTSSPCHSSCKSPCTRLANNQRLTTCNCQRVCTPFAAKSLHRNGHQHNSRHPTLRPTKPRPCAQPTRQSAPRVPNSCARAVAHCRNTEPERALNQNRKSVNTAAHSTSQ